MRAPSVWTTHLVVCHLHVLENADRALVRAQPVQPRRLWCAPTTVGRIMTVAVASALCALGRVSPSVVGHV